jgi:hypothetical protein
MAQHCRICGHPDRKLIDDLLSSGTPDLRIAKLYGIEAVSVGRHRRNHLLAPKIVAALDHRLAQQQQKQQSPRQRRRQGKEQRQIQQSLEAFDRGDPQALALASLSMTAQATKLHKLEQQLELATEMAVETGAIAALSNLAAAQLRAVEVGSRLAMTGGYKPVSAIPQAADRNVVSIVFEFPNAGTCEEIAFKGKVVDGDVVDPSAIPDDLPRPHPNRKIKSDEKLAGNYWSFEKLPDKAEDDDDERD